MKTNEQYALKGGVIGTAIFIGIIVGLYFLGGGGHPPIFVLPFYLAMVLLSLLGVPAMGNPLIPAGAVTLIVVFLIGAAIGAIYGLIKNNRT